MRPILLLEINEVPWRLVDRYAADPAFANIARFFERAHQFTSVAVDTGELSPWVTWPTLHRGISNEHHGIKSLGQDPSTFRGTPVWQEVRQRGGSIGVFGSMQSWPAVDPGEGGFYVPDTFAHDARCIPDSLSRLQAINLEHVRRSARVVDSSLPGPGGAIGQARALREAGVGWRTLARLALQVASERVSPGRAKRRPVYQAVIFWDAFRAHFDPRRPPGFTTFFTNHVAGVMHRYWKDVFPVDFPEGPAPTNGGEEPLMRFALGVLDDILSDVLAWAHANPDLVIVFATSMGQGAIHRGYHEGVELVVEDLSALMRAAGLERGDYRPLIAMVPQVAVEIEDDARRAWARESLSGVTCASGVRFVRVEEAGKSLSITVTTPPRAQMQGEEIRINGRDLGWGAAGIRRQDVEPGTGYHVPEGVLAVLGGFEGSAPHRSRARIPADRIKDWLLALGQSDSAEMPMPPDAGANPRCLAA